MMVRYELRISNVIVALQTVGWDCLCLVPQIRNISEKLELRDHNVLNMIEYIIVAQRGF